KQPVLTPNPGGQLHRNIHIRKDPYCLVNLDSNSDYASVKSELNKKLISLLKEQGASEWRGARYLTVIQGSHLCGHSRDSKREMSTILHINENIIIITEINSSSNLGGSCSFENILVLFYRFENTKNKKA
ncbi:MAG: hypothetical protein HN410_18980, partial [Prolixibacteraceae bacterium]|nr:hypothetical protein [Prolixibacteraceae bacterium]